MCFCFRSSSLPGASTAADARPGSIVFLLDPTRYRVIRCNSNSDSLLVFPAMGNKWSSFFCFKVNRLVPSQTSPITGRQHWTHGMQRPSLTITGASAYLAWHHRCRCLNIANSDFHSFLLYWQFCRFRICCSPKGKRKSRLSLADPRSHTSRIRKTKGFVRPFRACVQQIEGKLWTHQPIAQCPNLPKQTRRP